MLANRLSAEVFTSKNLNPNSLTHAGELICMWPRALTLCRGKENFPAGSLVTLSLLAPSVVTKVIQRVWRTGTQAHINSSTRTRPLFQTFLCASVKARLPVGGNMIPEGGAAPWIIAHSLIHECLSCFSYPLSSSSVWIVRAALLQLLNTSA